MEGANDARLGLLVIDDDRTASRVVDGGSERVVGSVEQRASAIPRDPS